MDTVFLALRVIVSLAAVFGALFFAHRWVTKGRPGRLRSRTITVVSKQGLGGKSGIAIVEAGDRRYLIGITDHAVTVLDRLDGTDLAMAGQTTLEQTVVSVVSTPPAPRPSFEHELAVAASGAMATLPDMPLPFGPGADAHALQPVFAVQTQTSSVPIVPATVMIPTGEPRSRREARAAEAARDTAKSPIAGSILSPETWRQTAAVLRGQR